MESMENQSAEVAAEEAAPEVTSTATQSVAEAAEVPAWQQRLSRASDLPEGMRKQLSELTQAAVNALPSDVEPQLSLGRVLDLLEGVVPFSMRLSDGEVTVAEHPSGESFFGGSKELTDADAERLAREQLERCGLLRK